RVTAFRITLFPNHGNASIVARDDIVDADVDAFKEERRCYRRKCRRLGLEVASVILVAREWLQPPRQATKANVLREQVADLQILGCTLVCRTHVRAGGTVNDAVVVLVERAFDVDHTAVRDPVLPQEVDASGAEIRRAGGRAAAVALKGPGNSDRQDF